MQPRATRRSYRSERGKGRECRGREDRWLSRFLLSGDEKPGEPTRWTEVPEDRTVPCALFLLFLLIPPPPEFLLPVVQATEDEQKPPPASLSRKFLLTCFSSTLPCIRATCTGSRLRVYRFSHELKFSRELLVSRYGVEANNIANYR